MSDSELSDKLRATLIDRLKLPDDADDQTILDVLGNQISEKEVAAAIRSGKVLAAHKDYWVTAMKNDVVGTRQVLASLATPAPPVRAVSVASVVAAARAAVIPQPPVRTQPTPTANTIEEMNAQINADPELQRAFWELGVRNGIEKPPERVTGDGVGWNPPWNPKHELVVNDDGTGQWVTPPADFENLSPPDPTAGI
jgi:hypothetical protein